MSTIECGRFPEQSPQPDENKKKGVESAAMAEQRRKIKAHEAGDVTRITDPRLMTTAQKEQELQACAQKSSAIWECVGRTANPSGGYVYRYRLREEYTAPTRELFDITFMSRVMGFATRIQTVNERFFPAIEPELAGVSFLSQDPRLSWLKVGSELLLGVNVRLAQSTPFLNQLGYILTEEGDSWFLTLPDRESLLASWQQLRSKYPELSELDIVSSEGIADDIAFAQAYLVHDGLLSEGSEFVHDSLVHIIALLSFKLGVIAGGEPHQKVKAKFLADIWKGYRRLLIAERVLAEGTIPEETAVKLRRQLEVLKVALGVITDATFALDVDAYKRFYKPGQGFDQIFCNFLSTDPNWSAYIKGRIGEVDVEELQRGWQELGEIEADFIARHKTKPLE